MGFLFFLTVYGMVPCLLALQAVGALLIVFNSDKNINIPFNFCLLELVHLTLTIHKNVTQNTVTHLTLLPAFREDPV